MKNRQRNQKKHIEICKTICTRYIERSHKSFYERIHFFNVQQKNVYFHISCLSNRFLSLLLHFYDDDYYYIQLTEEGKKQNKKLFGNHTNNNNEKCWQQQLKALRE